MTVTKHHVFDSMGSTVVIETEFPRATEASVATGIGIPLSSVSETDDSDALFFAVERAFAHLDGRFSLFRPESELSRVAHGSIDLDDTSEELRDLYGQSLAWRQRTGGAFTPHRPDGVIDLNGIVKAEALRRAGEVLGSAGLTSWRLTMGGDVLSDGRTWDGWPWTVEITDPGDPTSALCSLELRGSRRAVATCRSGTGRHGDDIWLDGTALSPDFVQVTVVANDIITADVLSTAIVAGGIRSLNRITSAWPIDVLAVDLNGAISATPGMRSAVLTR